jgi:SSS family solute:Na+ symporter
MDAGMTAERALHPIDWAVIGCYAAGLLAVGWYYSRHTTTREEFLLGDRQMRPLMVGLSLFAALISTITYLAIPGEIIKYGPVVLGEVAPYPLVGLVVGYLVIPFIMGLQVTSAYEILERRLGVAVRTAASLLFLSLRLLWMAVIIHATAGKVLIPLLGLDAGLEPAVSVTLAAVAVAYTSMGGLRAAVLTDVIQTGILFAAALATIVIITIKLGGVGAWWPAAWPAHWPEPRLGYDPSARMTLSGIALASFTWFVCTSTSDQIVVQRYLSTRDAKAARSVLFVSLAANVVVMLMLAAVGLGLLAYFKKYPELLPAGQELLGDSDRLFSRFIVVGLPTGVSGLVIAGLLACAMSSLAAGISSTCSVVSVDILERLRIAGGDTGVRRLRVVSAGIGVAVAVLSLLVGRVDGNLLELAYKVVNLFTAPLAGLFFLALFVPWAHGFGALIGLAAGLVTVILVSYWKELTGSDGISWIWAMPLGLLVEVAVGAAVSLVPWGRRGVA